MRRVYICTVWCYSKPQNGEPEIFDRVVVRGLADSPMAFGQDVLDLYAGYDDVQLGPLSISKHQEQGSRRTSRMWTKRGRTAEEVAADPRPVL